MELTQGFVKPKSEAEVKPDENGNLAINSVVEQSVLVANQSDSSFVSASHEFAVKQYLAAEDGSAGLEKAQRVAHSMGFTQAYEKNPFDPQTQRELVEAFETGERQKERALEESRIGKDDRDMDYDGR